MRVRDFSSTSVHAANRNARNWRSWFAILGLLGILSLGCELSQQIGTPPVGQQGNNRPDVPTLQASGFLASDCSVSGITFPDITVSYNVDDTYNGPYLICSSSSEGAHGLSVHYYINIVAYQAAKLDAIFQEQQANIQGFVDQSNEWNADPDIPAEIKDEIAFLRNDSDGYVFMITGFANVQNCLNGRGYGAEKLLGKYLVVVQFQSCELADAGAYIAVLQSLETAALTAIQRVEAAGKP